MYCLCFCSLLYKVMGLDCIVYLCCFWSTASSRRSWQKQNHTAQPPSPLNTTEWAPSNQWKQPEGRSAINLNQPAIHSGKRWLSVTEAQTSHHWAQWATERPRSDSEGNDDSARTGGSICEGKRLSSAPHYTPHVRQQAATDSGSDLVLIWYRYGGGVVGWWGGGGLC